MRVHNFTYKSLNFSDSQARVNNFAIQSVQYGLNLMTQVFEKTTWHWAYSTNTLSWGRILTISWTIFWTTRADRWNAQQRLQSIIKPEYYLEIVNRGFYEFTFENDNWDILKWQAKVYSDIRYEDTVDSPLINFSFDLMAENPAFQSYSQHSANGFDWFIGWVKLWTKLWVKLDEQIWELTITNAGNRNAPVKIQVIWDIDYPTIKNLTNWRSYGLDKSTKNVFFDNTWWTLVVTDEWINVKWYRTAWSKLIFLDPWINKIILTAKNNYLMSDVVFVVRRNDTFIN